ncbi:MAG: hypothetical protein JNK37_17425 [Verrucomicrobiales bacterium]|nr:hypothetical protein [Verrucomicrobiales bacterium]
MKCNEFYHANRWWPSLILALSALFFMDDASAQEVHTTFKNRTSSAVELFWIDAAGIGKSYGEIAPGDQKRQAMNAGNLWQVRQGTKVLREYKATKAAEQTVEVKPGFFERVIGIAKAANQPRPGGTTTPGNKSASVPPTPSPTPTNAPMPPAAVPVNPAAPVTT